MGSRDGRALARRAYERGRLRTALRAAWPALPLIALSLWGCSRPAATIVAGGLLVALVVFARWRGGTMGRSVTPGILAGLAPLILPLATACGSSGCPAWLARMACLAGGLVAGFVLGLVATRKDDRVTFLVSAGSVAVLVGTLGCAIAGGVGVLGMLGGFVVGTAPVILRARTENA